MTESEIKSLPDTTKARIIQNAFRSPDGALALKILSYHFDADSPSAPTANFQTNETMFLDGNKAVFKLIQQIMDGLIFTTDPAIEPETDIHLP